MPLFRKIIDEAADIKRINHVTLTGLGETLLDRHLEERLTYIRSKMPYILLDIYTNGSQLTLERGLRLAATGISVIYVSINGVSKEARQQIMGLDDYDTVATETRKLIDELKRIGSSTRVIVKAVMSKDLMENADQEKFMELWGGPWEQGGNAFRHLEGNWAGVMYPVRVKPTKACARALNEIMVLSDGRVSLCCFDGEGEVVFGDLNTQTIREVFAGEKALAYRQAHVEGRRQELKLCATCTAI